MKKAIGCNWNFEILNWKTNQTKWRTIYLSSSDFFCWITKQIKQNEGKTRNAIVIVYGIGVVYQKGASCLSAPLQNALFCFFSVLVVIIIIILKWRKKTKWGVDWCRLSLSLSLSFGVHLFRRKKKLTSIKTATSPTSTTSPTFSICRLSCGAFYRLIPSLLFSKRINQSSLPRVLKWSLLSPSDFDYYPLISF